MNEATLPIYTYHDSQPSMVVRKYWHDRKAERPSAPPPPRKCVICKACNVRPLNEGVWCDRCYNAWPEPAPHSKPK